VLVQDSNLRSFRDGFTVRHPRAGDLHERSRLANFRTYSAQTAKDDRRQPDILGRAVAGRGPVSHDGHEWLYVLSGRVGVRRPAAIPPSITSIVPVT
jgi:hypothetical protein